jgi:hypothetical protein
MHQMGVEDQFHAPAAVEGRNMEKMKEKPTEGGSTQHNGKKMNIRLLKHGFRLTATLTITENGQGPP